MSGGGKTRTIGGVVVLEDAEDKNERRGVVVLEQACGTRTTGGVVVLRG